DGRKFISATSSGDCGGHSLVAISSYLLRANKTAASSKDERRRGTTLASHGSALRASYRCTGRTRSGSRATFRTSRAAPFHPSGAFSIGARLVLLPVAAGN